MRISHPDCSHAVGVTSMDVCACLFYFSAFGDVDCVHADETVVGRRVRCTPPCPARADLRCSRATTRQLRNDGLRSDCEPAIICLHSFVMSGTSAVWRCVCDLGVVSSSLTVCVCGTKATRYSTSSSSAFLPSSPEYGVLLFALDVVVCTPHAHALLLPPSLSTPKAGQDRPFRWGIS
jgi:hypothetical protein